MKVFVYGSLKKNKRLHNYMKKAEFAGCASTFRRYPLVLSEKGWYPYLLNKPGRGFHIKGEVYDVNYSLLKRLDRLEEVPYYYIRKKITVILNGKKIKADTYFYAKKKNFLKKDLLDEF